jgi:DNA-binding NarL/FixJ family response regulator
VPAAYAASLSSGNQPETFGRLTPREAEVLNLLANGQSNKEIGRALELREITIKLHVRNVFRKLGVRNRVEAANAARLATTATDHL